MYLIIEDNKIIKSDLCSCNDKLNANNKYTLLIDISNPLKPIQYFQGEWHSIFFGEYDL